MSLPGLNNLTPRETEILTLIAEGKSLLEIAQSLHRSLKTIESHRLSIGRKLKVSNRVELAKIAIAHGLAELPGGGSAGEQEPPPVRSEALGSDSQAQQWERDISARVFDRAGPSYLNALTHAFSVILGVDHAGVAVVEDDDDGQAVVRSLAYYNEDGMSDQFCYTLAGTPCEQTMTRGSFCVPRHVAEEFPDDPLLREAGGEVYAGARLTDRDGQEVGVFWVIHGQERDDLESIRALLNHFAPCVAAVVVEINQNRKALRLCEQRGKQLQQANHDLRRRNQHLDEVAAYYTGLAERMSDGLVVLDQNRRIEYANKKFAQIVGVERDQLIGTPAEELLTESGREVFVQMQPERETDQMQHYEVQVRRPDGEVRDIIVAPRTLFDDEDRFTGSFAIVTSRADLPAAN